MAKAYKCDVCGELFDNHDYCNGGNYVYQSASIIKITDDVQCRKKYRDWYKYHLCPKCTHNFMKTVQRKGE